MNNKMIKMFGILAIALFLSSVLVPASSAAYIKRDGTMVDTVTHKYYEWGTNKIIICTYKGTSTDGGVTWHWVLVSKKVIDCKDSIWEHYELAPLYLGFSLLVKKSKD